MPRAKSKPKPRPRYAPAVATNAAWLESDSYDRRAWSDLGLASAPIRDLIETGERLVPHFDALLQDLFLGLFKYNLVWNRPEGVRRSAVLNRTVLEQILPSPAFELLKLRTLMQEDKAVMAALVLGEQVLETIRSEKLINRREMLDLWALEHQEQELEQRAEAIRSTRDLADQQRDEPGADPAEAKRVQRKIEELQEAAERAARVSEARLNQKARLFEEQLKHTDRSELKRMQLRTHQLAEEIDRVAQDSHDFSLEFGQG